MKYYYYEIKNILNNKKYIGITTNPIKREKEHFNNLKNNKHCNSHLQYAYNKDGVDNFKFIIIDEKTYDNEQEAYDYE